MSAAVFSTEVRVNEDYEVSDKTKKQNIKKTTAKHEKTQESLCFVSSVCTMIIIIAIIIIIIIIIKQLTFK